MKTTICIVLALILAGCSTNYPREPRTAAKESACDNRGISSGSDCKVILIR